MVGINHQMMKLGSVKNVRIRSLTIVGIIIKNSKIIINKHYELSLNTMIKQLNFTKNGVNMYKYMQNICFHSFIPYCY